MIVCLKQHENGFREVDIRASAAEYAELVAMMPFAPFILDCDSRIAEAFPFDRLLAQIVVELGNGLLSITVVEMRYLKLSGNRASLKLLSENIQYFQQTGLPGDHFHLEYVEEEQFLDPDANPVIINMI